MKLIGQLYRYQYVQKILLPYSVEGQVSRNDERYLLFYLVIPITVGEFIPTNSEKRKKTCHTRLRTFRNYWHILK